MLLPVANRFVAGETAAEALERAIEINSAGRPVILNYLGEHHFQQRIVQEDTQEYLALISDIANHDISASISIKPTQLGLDIDESLFIEQLNTVTEAGYDKDVFVWIDMEGTGTTEATIRAFEAMADRYPHGIGLCLQSNLRRTAHDIERLASTPGKIRLVKGAYREPIELAYREQDRVNERYKADLTALFQSRDHGIAVGSHDPEMIAYTKQLYAVHGSEFEFQLLLGIRTDAQENLARNFRTCTYIPYGSRWLSYFTRRMLERTENMTFAARAILGR